MAQTGIYYGFNGNPIRTRLYDLVPGDKGSYFDSTKCKAFVSHGGPIGLGALGSDIVGEIPTLRVTPCFFSPVVVGQWLKPEITGVKTAVLSNVIHGVFNSLRTKVHIETFDVYKGAKNSKTDPSVADPHQEMKWYKEDYFLDDVLDCLNLYPDRAIEYFSMQTYQSNAGVISVAPRPYNDYFILVSPYNDEQSLTFYNLGLDSYLSWNEGFLTHDKAVTMWEKMADYVDDNEIEVEKEQPCQFYSVLYQAACISYINYTPLTEGSSRFMCEERENCQYLDETIIIRTDQLDQIITRNHYEYKHGKTLSFEKAYIENGLETYENIFSTINIPFVIDGDMQICSLAGQENIDEFGDYYYLRNINIKHEGDADLVGNISLATLGTENKMNFIDQVDFKEASFSVNLAYSEAVKVALFGDKIKNISIEAVAEGMSKESFEKYKANGMWSSCLYTNKGSIIVFYEDNSRFNISAAISEDNGETWSVQYDLIRLETGENVSSPYAVISPKNDCVYLFFIYNNNYLAFKKIVYTRFNDNDAFKKSSPVNKFDIVGDNKDGLTGFSKQGQILRASPTYVVAGENFNQISFSIDQQVAIGQKRAEASLEPRIIVCGDLSEYDVNFGKCTYSIYINAKGVFRVFYIIDNKFGIRTGFSDTQWKNTIKDITFHRNPYGLTAHKIDLLKSKYASINNVENSNNETVNTRIGPFRIEDSLLYGNTRTDEFLEGATYIPNLDLESEAEEKPIDSVDQIQVVYNKDKDSVHVLYTWGGALYMRSLKESDIVKMDSCDSCDVLTITEDSMYFDLVKKVFGYLEYSSLNRILWIAGDYSIFTEESTHECFSPPQRGNFVKTTYKPGAFIDKKGLLRIYYFDNTFSIWEVIIQPDYNIYLADINKE